MNITKKAANGVGSGEIVRGRRRRAIVVRYELGVDEKRKLRRVARELGYRGLRDLLQFRGLTDL